MTLTALALNPAARDGRLTSIRRPLPRPGPGEVLVRVHAASLNYRDLMVADNIYGALPAEVIPLSDGAGEVVETGTGVIGISVGDRVAGAFYPDWIDGPVTAANRARSLGANMDGMLADHILLPAHAAIPTPPHLGWEEAATLPCAALTAWHALVHLIGLRPGQTLLLLGSGGVSVMALQFARMLGARVIHTSSSAGKRARLVELGAASVIDYRANPDWDRQVIELTDGAGVDAVLDVGGPGTLQQSFRAVRHGGTIITVGFVAGGSSIDPRLIISRSLRVLGLTVGSCAMFHEMNRAITLNQMKPVIGEIFSMERAQEAYACLRAGQHFGKIVITIP